MESIKKQAEREGGQLLMLPSADEEEVGGLSDLTNSPLSGDKDSEENCTEQGRGVKKDKSEEKGRERLGEGYIPNKGKTPEQSALLGGPNPPQYPTEQEFSERKDSEENCTEQGRDVKKAKKKRKEPSGG